MDKGSFADTYLNFKEVNWEQLVKATWETLYMTSASMVLVIIIGLAIGLLLFNLSRSQSKGAGTLYQIISFISNVFRSVPFIILIILLIPVTRQILGTFLGPTAAVFALVISAAPFYARLVEIALREVDEGVIEASQAMGATPKQIMSKVLLPESLPALISGGTVTTITMIGFTAMAGAINAGGLGGVAYQDGFMRNNLTITLVATIFILFIVFIIQGLGDGLVKYVDKRQNKQQKSSFLIWAAVALISLSSLVFFSVGHKNDAAPLTVLKVGASPTPHSEILEHVKPILAKEGIDLQVVKFDDYVLPNKALAEKEIDANYFQHVPFFNLAVAENNYPFTNLGGVHIELMGLYSQRIKNVSELKDGAKIITSNSTSDWGRVITILQDAGLVKVKEGVDLTTATFDDISENPKQLKFIHTLNPEILSTAYENDEGDLIAINANFADTIGLSPKNDGVLVEKDKSPYGNILVSRQENAKDESVQKLNDVLHSKEVKDWMLEKWAGKIQPVS